MPFVTCPVCHRRIDKSKGMTDKVAFEICARSHKAKTAIDAIVESEVKDAERTIQSGGDQGITGRENQRRTSIYTKSKLSRQSRE